MSIEGRKDNRSFNIPNLSPSRRLIEYQEPTAANGYSWYRLYDDGWVEQGGVVSATSGVYTIHLPVEMDSATYTGLKTMITASTSQPAQYAHFSLYNATTITIQTTTAGAAFSWSVSGKSARGASQQTRYIIKF